MAIDDLLDEHEQSERVRSWLRSNAAGLIGGVGLGLAGIVGWHWWQGQQQGAQMSANARYAQAVAEFDAGQVPADKGRAKIEAVSKGNPTLGAPDLTDAYSMYGNSLESIMETINRGRHGAVLAHRELLGETRARLVASYVWSLSNSSSAEPRTEVQ